jgi:RNA polymerase sigma factor (sigma-70 family)
LQKPELIPNLFKTEYRKIVSVLCKLFGIAHIEIAEDIVSDTFLLAAETWGLKGIPENPTAWLYTVAKNKTKDYFKRHQLFKDKISVDIKSNSKNVEELDIDLSTQNIKDSQLQMMFAVCHPVNSPEAQIGLALRILCSFGIDDIAEAFLSNKETINKRLFRAKEKLRVENIKIELPSVSEIKNRLEPVLSTLYLLFNEGYYSTTKNTKLQKELCLEALRLTHLLLENDITNKPEVNALMALMCFHSSRFEARVDKTGESILYDLQDRNLWNDELIDRGNYYLIESAKGQEISKYHLEASIAYWHSTKSDLPNKWENILQLYNQLLQIDYSPVVALNRTFALAKANGKEIAIKEAEKLNLTTHHLYFVLLGNLYATINNQKAITHFETALNMVKTINEKAIIRRHIKNLTNMSSNHKE